MSTSASKPVGVIGAGTMGAGIAQTAATAGWSVKLFDIEQSLLDEAHQIIVKRFERLAEKDRMTSEQAAECVARIFLTTSLDDLCDCDLIIEAIVEDFDIKTKVLKKVGAIAPESIIATNTSSLSINDLGEACGCATRFIGMHFFNPAPIMPLVEVIRGSQSSEAAVQQATLVAEAWGKTVVQAADTPGFIVNRVARPYYLESWRILEDNIAGVDIIDEAMQLLGEFRMGPFMLTDMIGQDINAASTRSLWERLDKPSRLTPSTQQEAIVASGNLGIKTGCGAYAHDDQRNSEPAIIIDPCDLDVSDRLSEVINAFCLEASCTSGSMLQKYIFSRVLIGIINEAMWAVTDGVASEKDIDTAMKLGTNYPLGPFEWANNIGLDLVQEMLVAFNETVTDNRFSSPPFDTVTAK
jgi:3-hydroxybutyryl-CoA dehydrogenase